jgi:hypothetical protein
VLALCPGELVYDTVFCVVLDGCMKVMIGLICPMYVAGTSIPPLPVLIATSRMMKQNIGRRVPVYNTSDWNINQHRNDPVAD